MTAAELEARNARVVQWLPLVWKIANKYWRDGPGKVLGTREDCQQIGVLGLLRAADTYYPDRGKFSTHAWRCIMQRLRLMVQRRRYWRMHALGNRDLPYVAALPDEPFDPAPALAALTPRERAIIERNVLAGDTLAAIGADLGISKQWVGKIKEKALAKLRLASAGREA